jgi:CubicO group peptidase (beta-lactamase class C family)
MTDVQGLSPDRFARVREAFAANFDEGRELGARFAACIEGEVVLDLRAGFADRARTKPFGENTLTPVFSTTKAVGTLLIARCVDDGRLDYDQPVADVWPEFAAAGKGAATVAQLLSHQCGLPGFAGPMDPAEWFDWDATCARLAAMEPMWPIGSASGYHPVTWGYLAGEVFRRVDGRTMGTALREDFAEPFGLDLWIGLPDSEHARVAEMKRPNALPSMGERTSAAGGLRHALGGAGRARRGGLAAGRDPVGQRARHRAGAGADHERAGVRGELDGRDMLLPTTIEAAAQERIQRRRPGAAELDELGRGLHAERGALDVRPGGRTIGTRAGAGRARSRTRSGGCRRRT